MQGGGFHGNAVLSKFDIREARALEHRQANPKSSNSSQILAQPFFTSPSYSLILVHSRVHKAIVTLHEVAAAPSSTKGCHFGSVHSDYPHSLPFYPGCAPHTFLTFRFAFNFCLAPFLAFLMSLLTLVIIGNANLM